jgi:hypothetical protein
MHRTICPQNWARNRFFNSCLEGKKYDINTSWVFLSLEKNQIILIVISERRQQASTHCRILSAKRHNAFCFFFHLENEEHYYTS